MTPAHFVYAWKTANANALRQLRIFIMKKVGWIAGNSSLNSLEPDRYQFVMY